MGPSKEEAAWEEAHHLAEVAGWMECKSKECQILDVKGLPGRRDTDGNHGWHILVQAANEVLLPLAGIEPRWEGRVCSRNTAFEMSY